MKNHSMLKKAVAGALVAASLVTPAAALAAGTASARPIESPNCQAISEMRESALIAARVAKQQGDQKAYDEYLGLARRANANYNRHCLT